MERGDTVAWKFGIIQAFRLDSELPAYLIAIRQEVVVTNLIGVYGKSPTSGQFRAVRTVRVNAVDLARVTIDSAAGEPVACPTCGARVPCRDAPGGVTSKPLCGGEGAMAW